MPVRNIYILGSMRVGELLEEKRASIIDGHDGSRLKFINEDDVISFAEVHSVVKDSMKDVLAGRDLPRGITGWYYQQFLQLDMMVEFDRVCKQEGIHYVICCGTLLGAVRHKGYIPWDDDADIAMLREEYEKFKKIAYKLDQSICFFRDHSTDPEYRWGCGKLRKTGTRYVRLGQEHVHCKTGVYVDIFPVDDIPRTTLGPDAQ